MTEEEDAEEVSEEEEMEAPAEEEPVAMEEEEDETIDLDEILREMGYGDDEPEPDNVSTILGGVDDLLNLDDVQLSGPLVTLQENPAVLDPYSDNTYDFINNPIPLVAPPRSM